MSTDDELKKDFPSLFDGQSSQDAADSLDETAHPLMKHSSFVAYVVFATFFMAVVVAAALMANYRYSRAKQRLDTFDQFDAHLVVPRIKKDGTDQTAVFSDSCYSCSVDIVYDPNSGDRLSGTNRKWRFKGKLRLTDHARKHMQFPSGAIIGDMSTILLGTTDMATKRGFVVFGQRDGEGVRYLSEQRRLSTWPSFESDPKSTYSVVPRTVEIIGSDTETGLCTASVASVDGVIYGAFKSSTSTYAVCTCRLDSTAAGSPPTEYCMELST